jgi:hypothetical protein
MILRTQECLIAESGLAPAEFLPLALPILRLIQSDCRLNHSQVLREARP